MIEFLLVFIIVTQVILALLILGTRSSEPDLTPVLVQLDALGNVQDRAERALRDELNRNRMEAASAARDSRGELTQAISTFGDVLHDRLDAFGDRFDKLTSSNESKLEGLRITVDDRLGQIGRDSNEKLERMRETVEEKLQGTLERRLGESFQQVSERLESVHKGLGEMQTLAVGVGDLKRVLSNVKVRGGWGEVQLEALLEQMLSPEQYGRNVRTNEATSEAVEFAIKLPGRDDHGSVVWLPIDAKFPMEDYQRLVDASHEGDADKVEAAAKALERSVCASARRIAEKYLNPPATTDFALLYLPVEGLYAEVVRRPGLVESLQRDHRIVVAGPSTLAALLNSLQIGFRTLAVQERASEVWQLLGAVKAEFGKFGGLLDGVRKKLDQASGGLDEVARKSKTIERRLRKVEELPAGEATRVLDVDEPRPALLASHVL